MDVKSLLSMAFDKKASPNQSSKRQKQYEDKHHTDLLKKLCFAGEQYQY